MQNKISDNRRIEYAIGYLALDLFRESVAELDLIESDKRFSTEVAEVRMHVHTKLREWDRVAVAARQVTEDKPDEVQAWILWACAARRVDGLPAAEAILNRVRRKFSQHPEIHYNLACYRCLQGDGETALDRLVRAFEISPEMKTMAMSDEDLAAIRSEIAVLKFEPRSRPTTT